MFLPLDTVYVGFRNGRTGKCAVTVDLDKPRANRLLSPLTSTCIRNHSINFEWGYGGSGSSQLALAILLDFTQDQQLAEQHYMRFKWAYVSDWGTSWRISGAEITAWLQTEGADVLPLVR